MRSLRDLWRRFYFEVAWNQPPGVYGTCDVCWEREWLPLKRSQDNAEIEELRRLLANATDPENQGDWGEARRMGWAYICGTVPVRMVGPDPYPPPPADELDF